MAENNNDRVGKLPKQPNPKLRTLDLLVGTWHMYGEKVEGNQAYEWMEGGFFLIHHFDLENFGQRYKGIEYIGHDEDSDELVVRLMGTDGSRFHYVWELNGDSYAQWFGDRWAANHSEARFVTPDRIEGAWEWPDEGERTTGYSYVMERIS